ncbi:transposase [Rhizobium mongolense]
MSRFPDEVDEALWDEACKRADGIREFLKHRTGPMTAADVKQLTTELDVSRSTVYRLIKLFRSGGTVTSLVDRKRGRPEGHRVLDAKREEIIRVTLSKYYLTRNRPTVSQLIRDVWTNCISAGHLNRQRRNRIVRSPSRNLVHSGRRRRPSSRRFDVDPKDSATIPGRCQRAPKCSSGETCEGLFKHCSLPSLQFTQFVDARQSGPGDRQLTVQLKSSPNGRNEGAFPFGKIGADSRQSGLGTIWR